MAAFLGLVQGISEFLPISSSGHLSIIQNLFGGDSPSNHLFFDVLLHLGTLVAVCLFYWTDIRSMAVDSIAFLTGRGDSQGDEGRLKPSVRVVFMVIVGTLPLVAILPVNGYVEQLYYNTPFISFTLIVTGFLLFISGRLSEGRKNEKTCSMLDAFIVGLAQAVATIPGLSRSGTTITVGLARGMKRDFAVKFSFLLSIPAILGSTIVTFMGALREQIVWSEMPAYIIAMLVAGVVGFFSLKLLKKIVMADAFGKFAYYCWGAGILSLILSIVL